MKFILGEKREMTQLFTDDGLVIPATIISVPEAVVTQVKTTEKDGYDSVQISSGEKREKLIKKAQKGHFKGMGNFKYSREVRLGKKDKEELKVGDKIDISTFEIGDKISVSGVSKGKGFQGVVKRHRFAGGPKTHGHRHDQRKSGSIGSAGIARVFPGTKMAGRMGGEKITVKNLRIVGIDKDNKLLFVRGAVPGRTGTLLEIVSI